MQVSSASAAVSIQTDIFQHFQVKKNISRTGSHYCSYKAYALQVEEVRPCRPDDFPQQHQEGSASQGSSQTEHPRNPFFAFSSSALSSKQTKTLFSVKYSTCTAQSRTLYSLQNSAGKQCKRMCDVQIRDFLLFFILVPL